MKTPFECFLLVVLSFPMSNDVNSIDILISDFGVGVEERSGTCARLQTDWSPMPYGGHILVCGNLLLPGTIQDGRIVSTNSTLATL
jgi:hypothetical protein